MRVIAAGVAAFLLAVPAAANAQEPLPVGENDGVRLVRERGALVVVFTPKAKKLWRRVAGRRVTVYCTEFLDSGTAEGGGTSRAPKRGRRIPTGDLTRGMDYCNVWLERRQGNRRLIAAVPLTRRGAVYLDERERVGELLSMLFLAGHLADKRDLDGPPTALQLLARWPKLEGRLIPLTGPAETPPPKTVGYWSDGAEHTAVVALSTPGRRLFIEYEGDVLHTNVVEHIYGDEE
jgi:hypothetical protein